MLNIGNLAKTYGILPSEVIKRATTFDLMITDVMGSWEKYQYDKAMNKNAPPDLSEDQMMEMLQNVKNTYGK